MDLHDGVIGSLYGVVLQLNAQVSRPEASPGSLATSIRAAIDQLGAVTNEIRDYIFNLRPETLEARDLLAGIDVLAGEICHAGLGAVVETRLPPGVRPRPSAVPSMLLIAREAISNAIRHAQASTIIVRLVTTSNALVLVISDNGGGIQSEPSRGMGQSSMRLRARSMGATLSVRRRPRGGTQVRLVVPDSDMPPR